jgi:hypothetical protein
MVETTGQIESEIKSAREDLRSNLDELEEKVKSVTDWRKQFQNNPVTMATIAFGGGLLLSLLARGPKASYRGYSSNARRDVTHSSRGDGVPSQIEKNLTEIKGALIGVAATQAKGFLSKLIPGFKDHLPVMDRGKRTNGNTPSSEQP